MKQTRSNRTYGFVRLDVILVLTHYNEAKHRSGRDIILSYGKDGYAVILHPIDDFSVPEVWYIAMLMLA